MHASLVPPVRAVEPTSPQTDRAVWLAVAIVAAACILRVGTLGTWPLWIDEAFTLHDAFHDWPPYFLHYALTRAVVPILGDGEAALRALPCAFGVLTVLVLVRHRPRGLPDAGRVAAVAASLLALSSWHLFWSQSARGYALQTLLVLIAFVAWQPPARWLVWALACTGALFCHPGGGLYLAAFAVLAAGRSTQRQGVWIAVGIAGLAAAVGVLAYGSVLADHVGLKGRGSLAQVLTSYGFQTGPLLLLAAALGAWPARGRSPPPETLLVFLPLGLLCAVSTVLFVTGYHAVATLPLVVLLAARGAQRLAPKLRRVVLFLLMAEQMVGLGLYHASRGERPRYREAAALAEAALAAGAQTWATQPPPFAYYLEPRRRELRVPDRPRLLATWTVGELERSLREGETTWVAVLAQELERWDARSRMRLASALAASGLEQVRLANAFGPKDLTVVVYGPGRGEGR